MRLLPRSLGGTWLPAAVAWAGLCAAAWSLLPPQPAVEWRELPELYAIADILSAKPSVVLLPTQLCGLCPPTGPVIMLDADTGLRRELFDPGDSLPGFCLSPDGQWALLHDSDSIRLRDTVSGATISPELTDLDPALSRQPGFSPAGDRLVYGDRIGGRPVARVFDLRAGRPVGVVPDAVPPFDLDRQCRWLASGMELGGQYEFRVSDLPGGSARWRLPVQPWRWSAFSPAGDRLFRFGGPIGHWRVCCVDLASGTVAWEMPLSGQVALPGDKSRLFTAEPLDGPDPPTVSVWETRGGRLLGRHTLVPGEALAEPLGWASPGHVSVLVTSYDPPDRVGQWLERWTPWLGVRAAPGQVRVVDVMTGRTECVLPGGWGQAFFLPDGRAAVRRRDTLQVWDIPPGKPLTWIAAVAGLLAIPPAGLAWRRSRRLRREVA
jgi:hypothetical protein